jgi:Ca-activated chloride channel homolog
MIFTLAYPWLLCWLAVPQLVRWLAPPHREPRQGLVVPFLERLAAQTGQTPAEGAVVMAGGWIRRISLIVFWLATALALARPQIIEPPITKTVPVRDLLLAVDLSGSMATQDFINAAGKKVDRLSAVKEVLDDFLARRKGDRVGLIFFGTAPFVQAPFTEDLKVCRQLLDEAQVRMAGPQTAFGDAIGLAITLFQQSTAKERVLIALTDGNDTSSKVPPVKAAEIANDRGIVIQTVAVGDPTAAGEEALDVNTLKNVATTTGGLYSFAADRIQLDAIYHRLDQIESHQIQTISHRPRVDIFYWPLALALANSFAQQVLQLLLTRSRSIRKLRKSPTKRKKEEAAV